MKALPWIAALICTSCGTITRTIIRERPYPPVSQSVSSPAPVSNPQGGGGMRLCSIPMKVVLPLRDKHLTYATVYAIKEWNRWAGVEIFEPITRNNLQWYNATEFIRPRFAHRYEAAMWQPGDVGKYEWEVSAISSCVYGGGIQVKWAPEADYPIYLRNVVLHMLGVSMGLDYVQSDRHIMGYKFTAQVHTDILPLHPDTIAQVRAMYGKAN